LSQFPFDESALRALGWGERVSVLYDQIAQPGDVPARLVRVERLSSAVVGPDGIERMATTEATPAVGDWVALSGSAVRLTLPRWSELSRLDPDGSGIQVLASNVDLVFICAPADRLNPARIERELAVAWDSGARPVVVLTKADLADPEMAVGLGQRLLADILVTSAATGLGLDQVRETLLPCRTAVLLGPSGAGKSSLVNALVGLEVLAVGAVRDADHRGRHTTTSRQLIPIPGGGVIVDTPGLRSLGLVSDGGVDAVFPDIEELAATCRFSDCSHGPEPGCSVAAAVDEGGLDPARLSSFHKLQREAAAEARRRDPLQRKAQLQVWKQIVKDSKGRTRPRTR
jgi:ribosome biogenesis GTPase / thiamine phosphate phosphatase